MVLENFLVPLVQIKQSITKEISPEPSWKTDAKMPDKELTKWKNARVMKIEGQQMDIIITQWMV